MSTGVSSSMLKKITDFLLRRKSGNISPAEAEKIQKASYTLAHAEIKKKFSPVYLNILPGLESEEKQVFEASVYYLAKIAENKQKYREEILKILNEKAINNNINPEFRDILKYQVQNILNKNN